MSHYREREKIKILFSYSSSSSFVHRDLEILARNFDVRRSVLPKLPSSRGSNFHLMFSRLLKGILSLKSLKGILWADIVYSWWANLNTFFVVLFCMFLRKKCMIVVGGYEVAFVPKLDYGALQSSLSRVRVKFILEHASKVFAVSGFNEKEILRLAKPNNLKLIYNGVDTKKFKPSGMKKNLVITVGQISNITIKRKGLKTFVESSKYLSNTQFLLIGKYDRSIEHLKKIAGPNLKFTGYVSDEDLLQFYQKAKVYCQLSAYESFGVALTEAMSCCCVPVTTRRCAFPEVVDDTGFYVAYNDPKATAKAIRKALTSNKGIKARERIKRYFSTKTREKKIVKEILEIMQ